MAEPASFAARVSQTASSPREREKLNCHAVGQNLRRDPLEYLTMHSRLISALMKTVLALAAVLLCMNQSVSAAEEKAPAPKLQAAIIGGGCFWCVEAQYKYLKGVKSAISGYAGGTTENPTYKDVCEGDTGHAEVVRVEFDPAIISYKEIIDLFWDAHDPTTLNRQGNDVGTQYRSIILYTSDEQKQIAEASMATAQKNLSQPITTQIVPLKKFYPAEEYHQNYQERNPYQGYVRAVVTPKMEKFKHKLEEKGKLKTPTEK